MKRLLDIIFSVLVLLFLWPMLLLIGLMISMDSPGGVFFRHTRIGKDGKPFQLLKFRSMRIHLGGAEVTLGNHDERITKTGRWIRKYKLDELPQFWNVLKGEMSIVGPRPESPHYVNLYTPEMKRVLNVKPGITDPASLQAFDEGAVLAEQSDPESYYREVVLPAKVAEQLKYLEKATWASDGALIIRTLLRVLKGH